MLKLIDKESGTVITQGVMLHTSHAIAAPGRWRFEGLTSTRGEHMIHCSRLGGRTGRVHRMFHPHVFGLTVEIEIKWHRRARTKIHSAWHETWVGIYLGFLALIGLAFFERYHMAPEITDAITSVIGIGGDPSGGTSGH